MNDYPICPTCKYPLHSTPCSECARVAEEKKRKEGHLAKVLGGILARDTFTMERFERTPANAELLDSLKDGRTKTDLYLHGPAGVGKTHLAVAICRKHWSPRDPYTVVWKMAQVARAVRCAGNAADEASKIRRLVDQRVLILDDLGTEKLTEFSQGLLYEIIDGRYMAGRGGLVVTSNLSLDQLAERLKDDRVPSRLFGMCKGKVFGLEKEHDHRMAA